MEQRGDPVNRKRFVRPHSARSERDLLRFEPPPQPRPPSTPSTRTKIGDFSGDQQEFPARARKRIDPPAGAGVPFDPRPPPVPRHGGLWEWQRREINIRDRVAGAVAERSQAAERAAERRKRLAERMSASATVRLERLDRGRHRDQLHPPARTDSDLPPAQLVTSPTTDSSSAVQHFSRLSALMKALRRSHV
jgi:hypothetical protein